METAPRVSVIVPCRNERGAITGFLENLRIQKDVPGGLEIIIADGLSNDGTRELLQHEASSRTDLLIIDNPAGEVSPGLNAAVRFARGEIIVRMDVHTEYAPDYIRTCVQELARTGAANVGGPALTRASDYFQRVNAAAYGSPFAIGGARFHDQAFEGFVDTVPYGCWLKSTLIDAGLFDEHFVRNQDDELNFRLTRSGGRIWQTPRIRSWYQPRRTPGSLFRQYFQYGYWKVAVIRKHRVPASWRHLVPAAAVLTGGALAIGAFYSSAVAFVLTTLVVGWLSLAAVATVDACRRVKQWELAPVLPAVFAIYHLAYGFGFLRGFADFIMRRRSVDERLTELTR